MKPLSNHEKNGSGFLKTLVASALGTAMGGAIAITGASLSADKTIGYQREARAFETKLDAYSQLDQLSLAILADIELGKVVTEAQGKGFIGAISRVGLVGSKPVRQTAAQLHQCMIKLVTASPSEQDSIMSEAVDARNAFRSAAQDELRLSEH